ncbi:hypothetical protein CMI41_02170 [Candidatus Pacearchaeota archaeon]|nr:hypothetical protein [Candidatus Pacearchaeota archaeon]
MEKMKDNLVDIYHRTDTDGAFKGKAISKLRKLHKALASRNELYFSIPLHVKSEDEKKVLDLPDWGLYGYRPMGGKGTRHVTLDVVHYTPKGGYDSIKDSLARGEGLITDKTGYAFFTDQPLPDNLSLKRLSASLGIWNQSFTGKTEARLPEKFIKMRVRVPRERVMQHTDKIGEKEYTKYAIAGGIKPEDILGTEPVVGQNYKTPTVSSKKLDKEELSLAA